MQRLIFTLLFFIVSTGLYAQKIDSIYFHLYTDSLKKGTHNYINVDGKLSDGSWMPLTAKEVKLSSSACQFSGNELVIPAGFGGEKITVKATLRSDTTRVVERTIWIKTLPDGPLPTQEEVIKQYRKKSGRKKRN